MIIRRKFFLEKEIILSLGWMPTINVLVVTEKYNLDAWLYVIFKTDLSFPRLSVSKLVLYFYHGIPLS